MSTQKPKYELFTLAEPGRALYANLIEASKPRTAESAKTRYSVTLGLGERDAASLFQLQATMLAQTFGSFTAPDDYQLTCVSGAKAAAKALASGELSARGKSPEERMRIMEQAEKRAALLRPFAGILNASSRVALHDRFLERYTTDLDAKERENADRMGFKLSIARSPKFIVLDTALLFNEHKGQFYRGSFLGGSFNLSVWPRKKAEDKDGVTAYLKNIVFVKDGERLSSERPLEDDFAHYAGIATDYSPSAQASVAAHQF